jgi:hypothetical protein
MCGQSEGFMANKPNAGSIGNPNGNLLLSSLPREEKKRLQPYIEVVELKMDETIVQFDKPIEHVYFPHRAVTSTVVATDEGSFLEVGLMGAEGMVGLSLLLGEEISFRSSTVMLSFV